MNTSQVDRPLLLLLVPRFKYSLLALKTSFQNKCISETFIAHSISMDGYFLTTFTALREAFLLRSWLDDKKIQFNLIVRNMQNRCHARVYLYFQDFRVINCAIKSFKQFIFSIFRELLLS